MHPGNLVRKALETGLDLIVICDHNSSENVRYVIRAASGKNIKILPGMEITTREEVHLVAIFNSLNDLAFMQEIIYNKLSGANDEDLFGVQAVVNEKAEVEEINNRFLLGAADLPLDEAIAYIHRYDGLAVAAHIDRENFSVLSQLGLIDPGMNFDALEISAATGIRKAREKYKELAEYTFITSSDAHYINDIGRSVTKVVMEKPDFGEVKMAFRKQDGRRILEQ